MHNFNAPATLINCTFSQNWAGNLVGGLIADMQQLTATNCVLWGNSDSTGTGESAQFGVFSGAPVLLNYSCIQGLTGGLSGVGNIGEDPLFRDADGADDIIGTEDDDLRLTAVSPCVDAADNTAVPVDTLDLDGDGDTAESVPFDLDGRSRFFDAPDTSDTGNGTPPIVDMGAYEFTPCGNGVTNTGEECDDGNTTDGDGCNAICAIEFCGDGTVNNSGTEQCDDGNTANGDCCDGNCIREPVAPPNVMGGIASRYIEIEPDTSCTVPVAFRIECGGVTEWLQLTHTDYDDGGGVSVNIGTGVADCASADFLTPDTWTSNSANALYVTGLAVAPNSAPVVTAVGGDCGSHTDSDPVQPANITWVFCDSSNDGQVTFFADLFKQFSNTAAAGGPNFTGPDPGTEVDTQGDSPSVPDQQVTFFADIFQCFGATAAGGGDTWTGPTCP
ncbi:MAG: DUF4215 domain-containing protein [Phycisphaerae bacterium]